jgi:hypothetical protein
MLGQALKSNLVRNIIIIIVYLTDRCFSLIKTSVVLVQWRPLSAAYIALKCNDPPLQKCSMRKRANAVKVYTPTLQCKRWSFEWRTMLIADTRFNTLCHTANARISTAKFTYASGPLGRWADSAWRNHRNKKLATNNVTPADASSRLTYVNHVARGICFCSWL